MDNRVIYPCHGEAVQNTEYTLFQPSVVVEIKRIPIVCLAQRIIWSQNQQEIRGERKYHHPGLPLTRVQYLAEQRRVRYHFQSSGLHTAHCTASEPCLRPLFQMPATRPHQLSDTMYVRTWFCITTAILLYAMSSGRRLEGRLVENKFSN